jgi:chitinase
LLVLLLACERNHAGTASGGAQPEQSLLPRAQAQSARPAAPERAARGQRVVAYVNCLCGFGVGRSNGACAAEPDPTVNHVLAWEENGTSPITHYALSFVKFRDGQLASDSASVWTKGSSTTDFELDERLQEALAAAHARGKKVLLSVGGESGSNAYPAWWRALGSDAQTRVAAMRAELSRVARAFEDQNHLRPDGFDIDIELGGMYLPGTDDYESTRELIDAVPDEYMTTFVPQVANGLCAAPVAGNALPPALVLAGQCRPSHGPIEGAWSLARLDQDCKHEDGSPKLEYFGIQYYNTGDDGCCGGGTDETGMLRSTLQNYVNLANGWPASGDVRASDNHWHLAAQEIGAWPAFAGIRADRLVIGKPGCRGCAGSDYVDLPHMQQLIKSLDKRLDAPIGGVLFWDLCRLFGDDDGLCMDGGCQPSWGGKDILHNLTTLQRSMRALRTR